MRSIATDKHALHATADVWVNGARLAYCEVPARVNVILAALQSAGLGPVLSPANYGLAPILAVHDAGFVAHLRTSYAGSAARFGVAAPVLAAREGITPTNRMVKQRLVAEGGHLGSLDRSEQRVVASLRNWGILTESDQRHAYTPQRQALTASDTNLEAWLLACALRAHHAEELPFADLLHLPELFPFRFSIELAQLYEHPWFVVQRQDAGWAMVRLHEHLRRQE